MRIHYTDVDAGIYTLCGYTSTNPGHAAMATTTVGDVTCRACIRLLTE